jgi:hypothetical protein
LKNILLILIVGVILLLSCTPYPRYRSDGPLATERSTIIEDKNRLCRLIRTVDLLEFGRIIQSYLGTPYNGQGKSLEGIDCSQFTLEVYEKFIGMELQRTAADQFLTGTAIDLKNIRYGDMIFFRINGNIVSHVGIFIGFNEFIHSSKSSGIIISNLGDDYWKDKLAGARRVLPEF